MPGRHAADTKQPKRGRGVLAVVAAVAVTLVAIFAVRALSTANNAPAATGCTGSMRVRLAVAPELVSVVRQIATSVTKDRTGVAGQCVSYDVISADPDDIYTQLSGGEHSGEPDLWIPDTYAWLERSGIPDERVVAVSPSVAASPVVLATSQKTADALASAKQTDNWLELAKAGKMALGDAEQDGTALSALLALRRSLVENQGGNLLPIDEQKARDAMGNEIVGLLNQRVNDLGRELERATTAHGLDRGVPASEQQIYALTKKHPDADVVAVEPKLGTTLLDYPLVAVMHGSKDERDKLIQAGTALMQHADTPAGRKVIHAAGFRDYRDLEAPPHAPTPNKPKVLPLATANDSDDVLRSWAAMSIDSRVLALIDTSGSMSSAIEGGSSRIEVAEQATSTALSYYPDQTQFGLWLFSIADNHLGPRYRVAAPIKTLDTTQRDALGKSLSALPDSIKPDNTSINDAMYAAYKTMIDSYDATRTNSLILVTDGRDEDPSTMREPQLLARLRSMRAQDKPISVILVGIGPEADMSRLKRIADAVGGKTVRALQAEDMQNAIIDSLLHRD